jgi:serine/threonine-protein kinase
VIGQTVGNYRITQLLGEGGMGAVYLAEHPGIGRKAAVKVLHPELTRHTDMAARFFNEARAANAIHHPGIVEVFDFGTLPTGVSYIVMELLQGESLAGRLRKGGPLQMAAALEYATQAAAALGAAHKEGIVHRDLKPDNLYLVPDPRNPGREMIKVLDFGIAKLAGDPDAPGSVKTRTGTIMGTPVYMSPEQCRGTKEVDHRTDIYALGVILYEMLCGAPPFVSEGHGELIHLHISAPPPPPRSKNPAIPERLEAVVLRALVKDPAHRFQTMAELARALAGGTLPATDPSLMATMLPSRPSTVPHPPLTTLSASPSVIERELTRGPGRRLPLVLGGLVLAAAAGYVGLSRLGREPAPAVSPVSLTPVPTPAAPTPAAEPAPAVTVTVRLTSDPPGARVVRETDGALIGVTPLETTSPSTNGAQKLRLEREGYRPEPVIVPLDRDVELTFSLKPLPAAATHKKQRPSSRPAAPGAGTPPSPSAPTPPPKPRQVTEPVPL